MCHTLNNKDMDNTVKRQIIFSDSKTYAAHWANIQSLIIIMKIISEREDEVFASQIKEEVKFLENVYNQL